MIHQLPNIPHGLLLTSFGFFPERGTDAASMLRYPGLCCLPVGNLHISSTSENCKACDVPCGRCLPSKLRKGARAMDRELQRIGFNHQHPHGGSPLFQRAFCAPTTPPWQNPPAPWNERWPVHTEGICLLTQPSQASCTTMRPSTGFPGYVRSLAEQTSPPSRPTDREGQQTRHCSRSSCQRCYTFPLPCLRAAGASPSIPTSPSNLSP